MPARPQRGRVVVAHGHCSTRHPYPFRNLALRVKHPAVRLAQVNTPCRHPVGRAIVRIEFSCALEEPPRFDKAVPREEEAGHPAQEIIVSIQALRRLPPRTLDLCALEPRLDGPDDICRHAVLQIEHVLTRPSST